jgi:hypothetical protein
MYKHINKTKKGVLILVAVMLLTIPNMPVYSAVGSYSTNSPSLVANSNNNLTGASLDKVAWWVAAAEAIALAYGAGYVLGTLAHPAYDALDGHPKELAMAPADYNSTDFSKFDN